jgi:hypothetical protein
LLVAARASYQKVLAVQKEIRERTQRNLHRMFLHTRKRRARLVG